MILVDYNQMIIANFMIFQKQFEPGKENDMVRHMVMNNIKMIRNRFCDKYGSDMVFCCDNKNNWRKDYFPLYEAAGPNKHLTHLEELILTNGKEGATRGFADRKGQDG